MTEETKEFALIIIAFVTGVVVPIVNTWIQNKRKEKTKTETALDIAEAANKMVAGGTEAVEAMKGVLDIFEERNKQQVEEIRQQRLEIINLKAAITALQIDKVAETAKLTAKIEAQDDYINLIVSILRQNNIQVPEKPDVLKDTGQKIKAVR